MHRCPYWNKVIAVMLAILLTGVTSPLFASQPDRTPVVERPLDGETLFRGLYFGQGPAARYFPEIWTNPRVVELLKNADMAKSIQAQNQFMELLRQDDATIFTRFGEEMQSGDQVRVRDTLVDLGERMRKMATERMGMEPEVVGGMPGVHGQCVVLAVVVAVVVAVAVAVAVAVYVYLYIDFYGPSIQKQVIDEGTSHLERDMWIDSVTHRLHPAGSGATH